MNPLSVPIGFVISAVACLVLVPLLCRRAAAWGLTDQPSQRKQHSGAVPTIGGIAIFLAVLLAGVLFMRETPFLASIIIASMLVVLGVIDDKVNLRPIHRLPFQILATVALIAITGLKITNIGDIVGGGPVLLTGVTSIVFTILCTVGVINAINMIDGVDGLSGTILLISFSALGILSLSSGLLEPAMLAFSVIGAIAGFLYYNARLFRSKPETFLGDSGSMLLGFLLLAIFISITQGNSSILSPVSAGWIFGVPLIDTVSVMVGRILKGGSPFAAGRDHLHHQLLDAGQSVNDTVKTMALLHLVCVLTGLIANQLPGSEAAFFWLFVVMVVAHHFLTPRLLNKHALQKS